MVKWSSVGGGDTLVKWVHPVHQSSMEGPCCSEGWWQEIREGMQVEGAWSRGCGKVPKTESRVYWHCLSSWARCACDDTHTHTHTNTCRIKASGFLQQACTPLHSKTKLT